MGFRIIFRPFECQISRIVSSFRIREKSREVMSVLILLKYTQTRIVLNYCKYLFTAETFIEHSSTIIKIFIVIEVLSCTNLKK